MTRPRHYFAGFDFGTTTSACVMASAEIQKNAVNGRMEFSDYQIEYAPDAQFTPLGQGALLDLDALDRMIGGWLEAMTDRTPAPLHGGAIVTGLSARKRNAHEVKRILEQRLGQVLMATVEDPRLESRVSFLGSASALSLEHPDRWFLNFDIGGGTTNIAYGRAGEVLDTASLFLGARHTQFAPGSFEVIATSAVGERLGLSPAATVERWVSWLEQVVESGRLPEGFTESAFLGPWPAEDFIVTFSGGVAELIYAQHASGKALPTTFYGDLGGELANAILQSQRLTNHLGEFVPKNRGRATVIGLALHNQDLSGSSVYLGAGIKLPLAEIVVLGTLSPAHSDEEILRLLANGRSSPHGAAVWLDLPSETLPDLTAFAERVRNLLGTFVGPVVFLTERNVGKTFGNLLSEWGKGLPEIVVLDELTVRDSHFLHIAAPVKGVIPVAFYGMG